MDRICQYSTIIFAGNMSVLLFVAIMTDYWEYRGFRSQHILKNIPNKTSTKVRFPKDTDTYFLIYHSWERNSNVTSPSVVTEKDLHSEIYYQPPALFKKYYYWGNVTVTRDVNNGTHNVSEKWSRVEEVRFRDEVVLFVEYGNLYRNCDDLEVGVRERLGLLQVESKRCFNFITSFKDRDFIQRELPAVIHLERSAFAFGLMCLVSSVVSVLTGGFGSLAQDKDTIIAASSSALVSAMALIISIALFHGKCHLMHRRQFMSTIDVPFKLKQVINEARRHYYGWSFVLAWICVVLCFVHSWVWLLKSQNIPEKYNIRRRNRYRRAGVRRRDYMNYSRENSAMIED